MILLFCCSVYGKTVSDSTSVHLGLLNQEQKNVLYEFAVLKKNGFNTDKFWLQHKKQFPKVNDELRDQLSSEVYAHSKIVFSPAKNSAIQFWLQTQSLVTWMFYIAAFIAICAIIALFKNYWNLLIGFLIKHLAPLFRFLFSPVLLTYELLVIGIVCVFYGCEIEEFVLRTVLIHVGLCLLWSQFTAIFAKEYLMKRYVFKIENNFWGENPWEVVKTICLPALSVTLAIVYVLCKVPADWFYNYEIVLCVIATIYALPFWRVLEKYLYPVLFPFKSEIRDRSINSLGGCVVIAIIAVAVLMLQRNLIFDHVIAALLSLLTIAFLILSSKMNYRYDFRNYYYLQFLTIIFLTTSFLYGFHFRLNEIIWSALIGASIYIVIKYFELFSFFSDWKRGKAWAWKLLGLAILLWGLAKGILFVSEILFSN